MVDATDTLPTSAAIGNLVDEIPSEAIANIKVGIAPV